jgi:eukaryotic-like serine/threonine-protein kinase
MRPGDDALADTVALPLDADAVSSPRASRRRGDRVGHFVVDGVLGSGGMGTVYRAHDTRLDRHVALKLLGGTGASSQDSPDVQARVWREARAAAAFNHPNAVSVYEIGETKEDGLYIAMEIVDGAPLRQWVGDATVSATRKLSYLVDVARALSEAHRVGLVHRDIKPENVMVRRDGVIKVLDFGIARRTRNKDLGPDVPSPALPGVVDGVLTVEGSIVGTPLYMAPEQILASTTVDARADQFSWGVMACELLTGALPWGADPRQAMARALRGDAPSLPLPPDVAKVLRRTLERDPAQRFASMDDVVKALLPSITEAPPRASRRGRIAVAVFACALLGGAVVVSRRSSSVEAPSSVPEAAAAFGAGMQAFRDGSGMRAARLVARAATLDQSFAAAMIREALWEVLERPIAAGTVDPEPGRRLFKAAEVHRAAAREYDRALIEAVEPRFRQSVDLDEAEKRLSALAQRHPSQGEPLYWLAMGRAERGDAEGARQAIARAMEVEPAMIPALLSLLAWVERKSPAVALATLDRCVARAPEATDCLGARARLRGFAGQCDGMEADAHAWIAADRESGNAFYALAEALNARGAPVDSVREALSSAEARTDTAAQPGTLDHNRFSMFMVQGDFSAALVQAQRLEENLPPDAAIAWRFLAVMEIADAAFESGNGSAAGQAALRFLKRADAWTPTSAGELAMPIAILRLAHRTGVMERDEAERARARWMTRIDATLAGQSEQARRMVWVYAFAAFASTAEDAREALAAVPRFGPLPAADDATPTSARMFGRVHLLAGDRAAALPYFRRAAGGCYILNSVAQSYGARVDLADTLAATGAKEEARSLYRAVLDRWGDAKPKSVTAERIRAALAAID